MAPWREGGDIVAGLYYKQRATEDKANTNLSKEYNTMTEFCVGVVSHHLFDHKPDNLLAKGSKYNLRGFYRFGTPGIAVVFGDQHNIDNYVDSLKDAMPQKKFEIRFQKQTCDAAMPKEWKEVELGGLRETLTELGLEECFFQVTGLDPSKATKQNNTEKGGKKNKGKKKK